MEEGFCLALRLSGVLSQEGHVEILSGRLEVRRECLR